MRARVFRTSNGVSCPEDVLDAARLKTLENVLVASNLVIGTTGIVGSKAHLRTPYQLARLGVKLSKMRGIASILFGAEDQGLSNEVLQECDIVVNVETSTRYPVMNISHAAAVILYSIASATTPAAKRTVATHADLDRLLQHTSEVLEQSTFRRTNGVACFSTLSASTADQN